MQNLLSITSSSDKLSVALFILSLISAVAIGYIFYLLSIHKFKLSCYSIANRIIGINGDEMPSAVKITYSDNVIPRLTRVVYAIWNDGNKVINLSDVAEKDMLRFEVTGEDKILSCRIVKSTKEINGISTIMAGKGLNSAMFTFDHLAKGDGFVVEILHTAERKYLPLNGTIKGLDKITYQNGSISKVQSADKLSLSAKIKSILILKPKMFGYGIVLAGILLILTSLVIRDFPVVVNVLNKTRSNSGVSALSFFSGGLLYVFLGLIMLWISRRPYPKSLHCEELN